MEYYIRFGEIPKDGFSKIHRGDMIMGNEPGVSVYDCCQKRNKLMICIPNPAHPFTMDTIKDFETDILKKKTDLDVIEDGYFNEEELSHFG